MTIAEFKDTVTTAAKLREVLGQPSAMVEAKVISALDAHCREFIGRQPRIDLRHDQAAVRREAAQQHVAETRHRHAAARADITGR